MANQPSPATEAAVVTSGLTKRFGDLVAVDSVDIEAPAGATLALLGPNGAGKTTIVRMLATLITPDAGSATVCGHDVVHEADTVRTVISLTGQFAALEANLTAWHNLYLMARLRGYGRAAARKIVEQLIERFDIGEFRDTVVKSVSGGQRRRIDLAASLVTLPKVLVLDEPTTGLDPRSRQVVWASIRELVAEGVTVLLTTQYLEEADELADRIVMIDHGRIVASGTPSELKAQIGDQRVDVTATEAGEVDRLAALLARRFEVTVARERRMLSVPAPRATLDLSAVTEVLASSGAAIDEIALRRPTLDDAFLALTGSPPSGPDDGGTAALIPEDRELEVSA